MSRASQGISDMNSQNSQQLLLVGEAAEFLRLRPNTIRSWILKKRIPYVKLLGGRVCIHRADLEELIRNSTINAMPHSKGSRTQGCRDES